MRRSLCLTGVSVIALGVLLGCNRETESVTHWVFFGTGADHIFVAEFDAASGRLGEPRQAAQVGRPGFLALHPGGEVLYAVGREAREGTVQEGFAAAYTIDQTTGDLTELNRIPTAGRGASHVAVNGPATALVAVNYRDGNTVSLSLEPDGRLGSLVSDLLHDGSSVHSERQTAPHPHSANFTPDGRYVIVPDLGTDELVRYAVDTATAQLERTPDPQLRMEPGSGPRHMTFHPNGRWAYVINELLSTVTFLVFDEETGGLSPIQTSSTLPDDYDGPANTTAEVLVHPNGRFLYGSNRGSNTIAVFAIDPDTGQLDPIYRVPTGGDWPRNFKLSPDGRFLLVANQRTDDVRVFRIDPESGDMAPSGQVVTVPNPMCVRFVPRA